MKTPRADELIARTIARLRTVSFDQDPLMSAEESFIVSIWDSAKKRDGNVIEAAIMDAIEQTPSLALLAVDKKLARRVDVLFRMRDGRIIALEIKRGSLQDSKAIRQMRADLIAMPGLISDQPVDFHIVFVSGKPPINEGLTTAGLKKLYKLDVDLHIDAARRRFSKAVRSVIAERTS